VQEAKKIVEQYTPYAYAIAFRLTGNQAAAWDLVQNAMLRVLKSWRTYDPTYKVEQWLYRIIRNLFIDRLRKEKRLKEDRFERAPDDERLSHADTWVNQLGKANEEGHARMQNSLNECFSYSLGIFEPGDFEEQLAKENIFEGEKVLQDKWLEAIAPILKEADLNFPNAEKAEAVYGGRKGQHTEHLSPLLEEMGEVLRIDSNATW